MSPHAEDSVKCKYVSIRVGLKKEACPVRSFFLAAKAAL